MECSGDERLGRHNRRMDFKPLITLLAIVNPLAIVPFLSLIHIFLPSTRAIGPASAKLKAVASAITAP